MKKQNKVLAFLLIFILCLTACSKSVKIDETKKEVKKDNNLKGTISITADKNWIPYYEKIIKKIIKENPDAKINIKEISAFEVLNVLNTDMLNPDAPDVFAFPLDKFSSLYTKNILAPIPSEKIANKLGGFENFDKGLAGNVKINNEYYGFPFNLETLISYVNTKNAKSEKIDLNKKIEFTKLNDKDNILLPIYEGWYAAALNNAGNINLLNLDGGKFTSDYAIEYKNLDKNKKQVFDAIFNYWKKHDESGSGLLNPKTSYKYISKNFSTEKKGVVMIDGPWATSINKTLSNEINKGNVNVYPLSNTTIFNKTLSHWKSGWALGINSRIEDKKEEKKLAIKLIEEIINPKNAIELYKYTGKILENVSYKTYEESDLTKNDKEIIKNVIDSYSESKQKPLFREYGEVWEIWKTSILSWNSIKPKTSEEAYKELNNSFSSLIKKLNTERMNKFKLK
ncbi:sugar ABC transporter substrate-binding protein [Helcococcus bovis]|uniref:sugar ABC transporter substrate-binding protein n=2 Tax=Helcococcus bovis TaxID=3153252 RepID=UPI0038B994FF